MSTPLGKRLPHESALKHTSGEALYADDYPAPKGLLVGMPVPSPHAHAQIVSINKHKALAIAGVHAILTAADIPGENNCGPVVHDEPILANTEVHCVGQAVALVLAESLEACRLAAAALQVEYKVLPAVCTLKEALEKKLFYGEEHVIERGEPQAKMASAPHTLKGVVNSGGQDHFYLETQCSVSVPGEDRTLAIVSSTQHPSEVQALVASVLGWGRHQVSVTCPRMGGAFGGKETQAAPFACMAALGSYHTGRPVKVWLDRDQDMKTTGRRHPFSSQFEVGFEDNGKIVSLITDLVGDGGWTSDLSLAIVDRALFHVDNAYRLDDVRITGKMVRTNRSSNTAFRGFGGPQGMLVIEQIMERIAHHLGADPLSVRRVNFYTGAKTDSTPYGQPVISCRIPMMADQLIESAEIMARRAEISSFNSGSTWEKRALAITPVKFGISFTASFLNQAGAFIALYSDGTLQLNHGGTEMGQGLYTKMMAICAHELGVSLSAIRHMPTCTEKVPNTSATAASSGADLNGMAVVNACQILVERLKPVAAQMLGVAKEQATFSANNQNPREGAWAWTASKSVTFAEVCNQAYFDQISMSAAGFYRTPDVHYDRSAGTGKPFHYFAYGMAATEVQVNGLTGQWHLRRVDLLQDVGDSLSSDIDRGQVEGAYLQGLGWLTMEELVFGDDGALRSHSPSTYKIPAIGDVPSQFHVQLLKDATQHDVVHGSKAVGEPPFTLALSAHAALQRAVGYFSPGKTGTFIALEVPATIQAIAFAVERAQQTK